MIAFPEILVSPAREAGMDYPPNPREFDANEYPHFTVFCKLQLGKPMTSPHDHWDNAKVIARVPNAEIKTITLEQLTQRGFV